MTATWWINPGKLLLFFLVPVYAFVVFVVPRAWPDIIVLKAGWYIRGDYALLGLIILVATAVFGLIGARVSIDARQAGSSVTAHPRVLGAIGTIVIAAYFIWFYPAFLRGSLAADRENMNRVAGLTSFTQLGVPFICCYLSATLVDGVRYGPLIRFQFWLILLLTVMRVQLWAERLAMIEVGVPVAVMLFTHYDPVTRVGRLFNRVVGALGPFLGIPALLLVFTVTEFFRSWATYSQTQNLPLMEFMTSRLVTYYFTALNNGAGLLATNEQNWPTFDFFNTAEWAYHLPAGVGDWMQRVILPNGERVSGNFLLRWADVEFNNMSGIFPIVYDFGQVLGVCYFCAFGFIAGVLYKSMLNGRALGLLFFPAIYVNCLEIMRIAYVNGPRALLIFLGSIVLYVHLRTTRARRVRHQEFPGSSAHVYRQ